MSRFNYTDEEDRPGQFALWQANCTRSLRGKAGQEALKDLEAALLALPSKRLIADSLIDEEGEVCAVGALALHKKVAIKHDSDADLDTEGFAADELGVPRLVAWTIVMMNDEEFDSRWTKGKMIPYTPEERYEAMLNWVRLKLAEGSRA